MLHVEEMDELVNGKTVVMGSEKVTEETEVDDMHWIINKLGMQRKLKKRCLQNVLWKWQDDFKVKLIAKDTTGFASLG